VTGELARAGDGPEVAQLVGVDHLSKCFRSCVPASEGI
jgi:hypothetical protein